MLTFNRRTKIFVCEEPTDMRTSYDTLFSKASEVLNQDPFSGHLILFATAPSKEQAATEESLMDVESKSTASTSWAHCMKRVFNVDPLLCPRCGETMKIKAFITDSREIERSCKNLSLVPWRAPPSMAPFPLAA